jgi:ubiquinone/menaquinone biosynthesis C-methylase UbiE/DNA-binding transcriptional ArsR family regulator
MDKPSQTEDIIELMGALSDPKRLRILHLLEGQELGVVELCDVLQSPQSTISRQLKVLAGAGWVRSRRQGTAHLYRTILDELEPAARRLWIVARQQTQQSPSVLQDQLRLRRRLEERIRDSQSFFAGAAGEWDRMRDELYGNSFSASAALALLPETAIVADLGCGTGQIAGSIAPYVSKVIGVDNSPNMLKAAGRRLAGTDHVELRRGELTAIPIDSASCDAALMILALTYLPEPKAAIMEMSRILKPGGKAVVLDLLRHDRDDFRRQFGQRWLGFEPQELQDWLIESKFQHPVSRPLPTEQAAKGPALFLCTAARRNE